MDRNSPANAGDVGLISGLGKFHGEGNGKPLQYSCLEDPLDGGAWWATVHGVTKSQIRLSDFMSLGKFHMPQSHYAREQQLLSTCFSYCSL